MNVCRAGKGSSGGKKGFERQVNSTSRTAVLVLIQGVALHTDLPLDMTLPTPAGTTDAMEIRNNIVPSPAPTTDGPPNTTQQQPLAGTIAASGPRRRIVLSPSPSTSKGTQHNGDTCL
jgi:hypothetical protein